MEAVSSATELFPGPVSVRLEGEEQADVAGPVPSLLRENFLPLWLLPEEARKHRRDLDASWVDELGL